MLSGPRGVVLIFLFVASLLLVASPANADSSCRLHSRFHNRCSIRTHRHTPPPRPRERHRRDATAPGPATHHAPRSTPKTTGCKNGEKKVDCSSDDGFWSSDFDCYMNAIVAPGNGTQADPTTYLCRPPTGSPSVVQSDSPPPTMPVVTEADLQKFALPAPRAKTQPDGWTVTGFPTNMYTDSGTTTISLTILGFDVRVRARPVSYQWDFGDGHVLTTHKTGRKIDAGDTPVISHVYQRSEHAEVSLTTHYTGAYSVAGGVWLPIAGEAAVTGTAAPLDVYRYHRYRVGHTCTEDPAGPDCNDT